MNQSEKFLIAMIHSLSCNCCATMMTNGCQVAAIKVSSIAADWSGIFLVYGETVKNFTFVDAKMKVIAV